MRPARILFEICRTGALLFVCFCWTRCATKPESSPAFQEQNEADLVVNFQSWNAISFLKPDITGTGGVTFRPKTFTKQAVVKLVHTLQIRTNFVVVVLDRQYSAGARASMMDEIQAFFEGVRFQRVAIQDGAAWNRTEGLRIVRDTGAKQML